MKTQLEKNGFIRINQNTYLNPNLINAYKLIKKRKVIYTEGETNEDGEVIIKDMNVIYPYAVAMEMCGKTYYSNHNSLEEAEAFIKKLMKANRSVKANECKE